MAELTLNRILDEAYAELRMLHAKYGGKANADSVVGLATLRELDELRKRALTRPHQMIAMNLGPTSQKILEADISGLSRNVVLWLDTVTGPFPTVRVGQSRAVTLTGQGVQIYPGQANPLGVVHAGGELWGIASASVIGTLVVFSVS